MAEITATAVKQLRERTGLPLMDCKKALSEANGDEEVAIQNLRENGLKIGAKRGDRDTAFGSFGLYGSIEDGVGALVELKCESAPVAKHDEFLALADDLAKALATGPGAETPEELLAQPSPSKDGLSLAEQKDELFNRMREVFNVGRMIRIDGPSGGYVHRGTTIHGVLVEMPGGNQELCKDVAMHIASMKPTALNKEDLPADAVEQERETLRTAALNEGKPEAIVDKMVEGRMRNFYAETVLNEQPFVKDDKQTVGKYVSSAGGKIEQFVHWEIGQPAEE
jgi:elongation factor Ts